jgi:hypothetical protein
MDCCNLWAHLRVGCIYAFFYRNVTRQIVVLLRLKCGLAWIASMVMVSALKPD